jgi:serine protease Do
MTTLTDLSRDLEELVARTAPSVVAVEHGAGHGSGVIVAGDGYVITNSHVARSEKDDRRVRLASGEDLAARLVGDDPASDLAVLHVDARGLPSLPVADDRRLRVGQLVVAIGNPLRFERSVSLGVVSAIERSLPGPRSAPGLLEGLVQTDAAINPGNSGGPLLDATGAVVGINTAIIPYARGLGFAIPAHTASWILPVLMQRGTIERPLLGIQARGEDLSYSVAGDVGQSRGVRVHSVGDGTPAARAGIRRGDLVLAANGRPVYGIDDLQRVMVLSAKPELELSIWRGKGRHSLSARPERPQRAA